MTRERIIRNLAVGEVALYLTSALALILWPHANVGYDGICWFLVHFPDFLLVGAGMVTLIFTTFRAAIWLPKTRQLAPLRYGLLASASLLICVVLTPYTFATVLDWIHMSLGVMLFCVQGALSLWLAFGAAPRLSSQLLVGLEAIGAAGSIASLPDHAATVLFQGEMIFQLAFIAILLMSLWSLLNTGAAIN